MEERERQISANIRELAAKLAPVLKRYGVVRAGVFGSVARGEATPASDLDLLVEYRPAPRMTLHDLVALHDDLEEIVGRKVEVIEYHLIREIIREGILADEVPILS
jgi:predicted nucleotidyltransferase